MRRRELGLFLGCAYERLKDGLRGHLGLEHAYTPYPTLAHTSQMSALAMPEPRLQSLGISISAYLFRPAAAILCGLSCCGLSSDLVGQRRCRLRRTRRCGIRGRSLGECGRCAGILRLPLASRSHSLCKVDLDPARRAVLQPGTSMSDGACLNASR